MSSEKQREQIPSAHQLPCSFLLNRRAIPTRRQSKGLYRKPPDNKKATSPNHPPIQKEALVPAFGGTATASGATSAAGPISAAGGEGGRQATGDVWVPGAGYEMVSTGKHKRGASGQSIASSDSHSSSNRSSPGGISRLRDLDSANDAVRDEDSWSSPGGKRGSVRFDSTS